MLAAEGGELITLQATMRSGAVDWDCDPPTGGNATNATTVAQQFLPAECRNNEF